MGVSAGAAIIGAGLGSAVIGGIAAKKSAKAQKQAAKTSSDTTMQMFYQNREDLAPWRTAGARSLTALEGLLKEGPGQYTASPGYQFRLGEGLKAIDRMSAARGGFGGGAHGKGLVRFAEDYATNDYDNFLQRYYKKLAPYQSLAGLGQTSAVQTTQLGAQAAERVGAGQLYAGQVQSNMYTNMANQFTSPFIAYAQYGALKDIANA